MSLSRAEKIKRKRINEERIAAGEPPLPPRTKPRSKFAAGIAIASSNDKPKATQSRKRKDIHPLDRLFFHSIPRKLSEDEFETATIFRLLCECLEVGSVDSTQALLASGGTSGKAEQVKAQMQARASLKAIAASLPSWEYEIVRKVCGEGWPLKDAVMQHSICHRDGVLDMFRNALAHLKQAFTLASIPWRFVATATDYRKQIGKQNAA